MISSEQEKNLRDLVKAFLVENAKVNLSSHRTEDACWKNHIEDSLPFFDIPGLTYASVFEVGMGGGFPVLVLAVMQPEKKFAGLDAIRKKVDAVKRITEKMGIENMHCIVGRAEDAGRDMKLREAFDCVIARAVAPLPELLEYCSPFTNVGGAIVLWKSLNIADELAAGKRAAVKLGCAFKTSFEYGNETLGQRQLLVFRKEKPVGKDYPRPVGAAKKNPLS